MATKNKRVVRSHLGSLLIIRYRPHLLQLNSSGSVLVPFIIVDLPHRMQGGLVSGGAQVHVFYPESQTNNGTFVI